MIADDEEEIRQALSNYIPWGEMGFIVIDTAENGKKALECVIDNKVDVLLCDVKMPVMNGIELAREIYDQKIKTKVIFLSAYRDFDFAKKAIQYGVEDYIVKPTKYQELLIVFNKVRVKLEKEKSISGKELDSKEDKKKIFYRNKSMLNTDKSFNEKIIAKVKRVVREDYKTVSLSDVAEKVHLSPSYLSKFFKDITGENFSEFVTRVKMEEAERLLMDIDYCVYEVSQLLGYSNPKSFTRAFKSFFGKTPRDYRKG